MSNKISQINSLNFKFDGKNFGAKPGDSIAAALMGAGEKVLGCRRSGKVRGVFCGMGVCNDCLVTVNGIRGIRACMEKVRDGISVESENEIELVESSVPPVATTYQEITTEVLIIGAGPAGFSAAIYASNNGANVTVLDEREDPGGQYFKQRTKGYRGSNRLDRQHLRGNELINSAVSSGAQIIYGQTVWFARREGKRFHVRSLGSSNSFKILAKAVIVAVGAYERPTIVPGWTLPGSITIGAAQTLARRYGIVPGSRVVIAGHGPLGLQLASELISLGANVLALAERGRPRLCMALFKAICTAPQLVANGVGYRLSTLRANTKFLPGWELSEILGENFVEGVNLRQISTGQKRQFNVDIIAAGDGFAPQLEMSRLLDVPLMTNPATGQIQPRREADGRTEVDGVWIAGDAGGLGGAEIALLQGKLSAIGVLASLGYPAAEKLTGIKWQFNRARKFQSALWSLYGAPERRPSKNETTLCRCEEVSVGTARNAIAKGAHDPAVLKCETRIGMGRCQGRYCLPQTLCLLNDAGHPTAPEALFAPQIPARPLPLGALGLEKAEWGGHRESLLSLRPVRNKLIPLTLKSVDLIIIGAGITGVTAALYAARQGASVVCLDRGRINGEASGGNAGSLHLQLLSWDFGKKAVGDGRLQLDTLPLQKESIELWRLLETELDVDFEMSVTGGLMVAESEEQMSFLETKSKAEASVGIETEVIDFCRIKEIAPAISDKIIGAAWCPGEGKINPLVATSRLAAAAKAEGAIVEEFSPVTNLERNGNSYTVTTPRGSVDAKRILIAAGGWSQHIAGMLGSKVPIRGAPLQMIVTAPAAELVPCLVAHADRHLTMKQNASGSIIIGGAWPAITGAKGKSEILPDSLEGNLWVASHTVPKIANLHVIRTWAAMNIDIDGAPLLSSLPGFDRVTIAATANGYTLGPLMGREAAELALSGRSRQDFKAFSMARFTQ
ncbi:MAG: FAD-dependent oxidoreductase [Paracoccaceae bacterium]|nr:FAD-dependent oxidoreductase [Paracoccaceae bacterium]